MRRGSWGAELRATQRLKYSTYSYGLDPRFIVFPLCLIAGALPEELEQLIKHLWLSTSLHQNNGIVLLARMARESVFRFSSAQSNKDFTATPFCSFRNFQQGACARQFASSSSHLPVGPDRLFELVIS